MRRTAFAPAKVNLFLHVGPLQPDGYHPICSLMVFADVGDVLSAEPSERFRLRVEGPFAEELGADEGNLVLKAVDAFRRLAGVEPPPLALTLDKRLPIASGLGGGTSDGAACLRLLGSVAPAPPSASRLLEAAAALGADGPACLTASPVLAQGRGERLSPAPPLPELHAVLVNPRAPSPTGAVYRAYDARPSGRALQPASAGPFGDAEAFAEWLHGQTRNDLQAPAAELEPSIPAVLARLAEDPDVLIARMSGSGATCFALCRDAETAAAVGARLRRANPRWWVSPCRLGAPALGQDPAESSARLTHAVEKTAQ